MTGTEFDTIVIWLTANAISILIGFVILIAGWVLSGVAKKALRQSFENSKRVDKSVGPILADIVRYGILAIAVIMALNQMGVQTTSILAVLGAAGLAIALALQGTLSNIAAGMMLIWLKPISTGEYIDTGDVAGTVMEIGLFATRLKSADGVYLFAPNSTLWNTRITNYTREATRRLDLKVGIGYSDDMSKARDIMLAMAKGDDRVKTDPEPVVYVSNLGDSAVEMMLRIWVGTPDYWAVLFEFTEKAKRDFDAAGITIPFNQVDVNLPGDAPAPAKKPSAPATAAKPASRKTTASKSAAKPGSRKSSSSGAKTPTSRRAKEAQTRTET